MDCNQEQCQDRELLFHREIPPTLRVGDEWHKLEEYVNWQTGCGNLWELEIRGRARGPRPRSPDWTLRIGKSHIDQVLIWFSSEHLASGRFHLFAHCPLPTSQWALDPLCKVQPPTPTHSSQRYKIVSPIILNTFVCLRCPWCWYLWFPPARRNSLVRS